MSTANIAMRNEKKIKMIIKLWQEVQNLKLENESLRAEIERNKK